MVRFPRGCRDRSLSRKLSGKVRSFNEKTSNHFWPPFLAKFQRFGLPLVLFTRNTSAPVPPFIDAGQSLTALLLRQSSTHGSAFFNTFVCACFFLHTHGWLNLLVHYCNATKTTKLSNCFESRTQQYCNQCLIFHECRMISIQHVRHFEQQKCPFRNIRSKLITVVFMACKFMTFVGTTSLQVALHVLGFDALRVFRICASSMCASAIAAPPHSTPPPPHGNINVTTKAIKDRGFLCACIVFFELKNIRKSIIGWLRLSLPLLGQKRRFWVQPRVICAMAIGSNFRMELPEMYY